MRDFLRFVWLFLLSNTVRCFDKEDRSICFGKHATSEPVIRYCDEIGGELKFRCCRGEDNATFVAIDLMDANLTAVPDFQYLENLNLSVIDLRDNPELQSGSHGDEYLTMKYLNELLLPPQIECPGGASVWKKINETIEPPGWYCLNQIDICTNSTSFCVEHGAVCSGNGPNHFECVCKSGYHGYKCLRYGKFPTAIFLGSTAGVTIVASAILFWTQRRHVKK